MSDATTRLKAVLVLGFGLATSACSGVEFAFDELISLESLERNYVMHVLNALEFNKLRTAEVLGIDPSTLYRKLSLWGLESSLVASPSGQRSPPDGPPQVPQNAPRAH